MRTVEQRSWSDLSPRARASVGLAGLVQAGLLVAALRDLRRRGPEEINGSRWVWGLVSLINFIGPLTYFAVGRRSRSSSGG